MELNFNIDKLIGAVTPILDKFDKRMEMQNQAIEKMIKATSPVIEVLQVASNKINEKKDTFGKLIETGIKQLEEELSDEDSEANSEYSNLVSQRNDLHSQRDDLIDEKDTLKRVIEQQQVQIDRLKQQVTLA